MKLPLKNRPTNFNFSWQSQSIHFSPRWKCSGYRSGQYNTYLIPFPVKIFLRCIFHLPPGSSGSCWEELLRNQSQFSMVQRLGWPALDPWSSPQLWLTPAAHNQSKFSKLHIDFPLMMMGWLSAAKGRTMLCSTQSDNDQPGVKTCCRHSFLRLGSQNSFNERNKKTSNTNEGPLIVLL